MAGNYVSVKIGEDQAAKIAQELYGIEGSIEALSGEVDFNFHIIAESGDYLLKIGRPGEDEQKIVFQQSVLSHVNQSNLVSESPEIIPDLQGNGVSEITDESGRSRKVRLFTWIKGRLWSGVNPINDRLLNSLGVQAGTLTKALQDFDHPDAHRKFDWDLAQAGWTYDYLDLFSEEQRSTIAYFQVQYGSFQEAYQQLRKGVVHNDANDNNIIVSENLIEQYRRLYAELNVPEHARALERIRRSVFRPARETEPESAAESEPLSPTRDEKRGHR